MTTSVRRLPLLLLIVLTWVSGCRDATPNSGLATVPVKIGDKTFTLEIANTDATRQTGLMNRDSMAADHGMIFIFTDARERAFWMKNTKIPLDILYLERDGEVVSIRQMQPLDETAIHSVYPAKFAIELNLGTAEKVGVKVGHFITLPPKAQVADE